MSWTGTKDARKKQSATINIYKAHTFSCQMSVKQLPTVCLFVSLIANGFL